MLQTLDSAVKQPVLPDSLRPQMKELEHQADAVVRDVLSHLERSFVTPIEREDIHLLAVTIDDVADAVDAAVNRMDVFDIREPTTELRSMTGALNDMGGHLVAAVTALRTMKPFVVRQATGQVEAQEERIDVLFRSAMRTLAERRPEAHEFVRWKEVYDILESASDHGRRVARTVDHILVRQT
jgi:uncharacterized protein Yka (UPF0111/DUF47 family)